MQGIFRCFLTVTLTGLLLLSGCNSSKPEDSSSAPAERELIKLSVWCSEEEQDIVVQLCESYARTHPEKKFAFTLGAITDSEAALQVLADKTQAADVFCFSSEDLGELAQAGVLLEITDRTFAVQSLTADSVHAAEYDKKLYGLPFAVHSCIMYYDKSKLAAHEAENLDVILEKNIPETEINLAMDLTSGRQQAGFFAAAGCRLFGDSCSLSGSGGMLAGEYMLGLVKNKNFAPDHDGTAIKTGFAHGTVTAGIAGIENAPEIKSSLGKNFGTAPLPSLTLPDGKTVQLSGVASYRIAGVNAETSVMQEALEFAQLLAQTETQQHRLERLGIMPVGKTLVTDADILEAYPELQTLTLQLKNSSQPLYDGFLNCAESFGQDLISGKITLNNLQERLNRFTELAIVSG